jgi:hypothetical protein
MRYSISYISPWILFQIFIFPASTSCAFRTSLHLFTHNRWGPLLRHHAANLSLHTTTTSLSSSPEASAASSDDIKTADVLSLDSIRSTLIRQEETIIFALIERAQFRRNDIVYQSGGFGDLGLPLGSSVQSVPTHNKDISHDKHYPQVPLSFLEYMLIGTVRFDVFVFIYICYSCDRHLILDFVIRKFFIVECDDIHLRKNTPFSRTVYPKDPWLRYLN